MQKEIHNERCFQILKRQNAVLPWTEEDTCYFASGREALVALIRALDLPKDTSVLIPCYVPEGILAPFKAARLSIQQYSLDGNLDPKWDHLEELLKSKRPRLAVMIHYFGLVKQIGPFTELCHRYGALVIEDMAHVMQPPDGLLGRTGDFILYSLPKMVAVPDGAPFVVRTSVLKKSDFTYLPSHRHLLYVHAQLIQILANTLSRKIPGYQFWRKVRGACARFFDSYRLLMSYYTRPNPMSRTSRWLLSRLPWQPTIEYRKALENRYRAELEPTVFVRFPNEEGTSHCSMGFPVRVQDRPDLIRFLRQNGVDGVFFETRWDFIPRNDPLFAESIEVMKTHFLFPTSQSLSWDEVGRVIFLANQWAKNHKIAEV